VPRGFAKRGKTACQFDALRFEIVISLPEVRARPRRCFLLR